MAALLSSPAYAFQETQISPDAVVTTQNGASKKAPPADSVLPGAAGLSSAEGDKDQSEGTVVTIPGLGKIGLLPKLDFGLELLYGAKDKSEFAASAPKDDPADSADSDVMIRGTVKHRF